MSDTQTRTIEASKQGLPVHDDSGPAAVALVPLLSQYLDDVALHTSERVKEVAGVSVTLSVDEKPWTVGASTALAAEVDLMQYAIGTGPCLTALREGIGLYVPDLAHDHRWNDYGPRAAARGAASCISVPVFVRGGARPAAVLKVYSARVDGLTDNQQTVARTAALEVAGGIGLALHLTKQAQLLDDRESAMNTRRTIDLALGILMERMRCDPAAAFESLRTVSQNRNVKLRDAARQVLTSVPGAGIPDTKAPFNNRTKPAR